MGTIVHNRGGYRPWALGFYVTALPLRDSHAWQRRTFAPGTCHSMASCRAAGPEGAAGRSRGYFLTEPSVKNACTHNTSVPLWLLRNAYSLGVQVPLCFKKGPAEASGDQAEALHNMHYFHPSPSSNQLILLPRPTDHLIGSHCSLGISLAAEDQQNQPPDT